MRPKTLITICSLFLLMPAALGGCGFLEEEGSATKPKPKATNQPQVKDDSGTPADPPQAGPMVVEINLGTNKLTSSECHVQLLPAQFGLPAILKVTSYKNFKAESFPSILIQANAPSDKMEELVNQTLSAKIFLTDKPNGKVWQTPADQPAQIVIQKADDAGRIVGEVTSAELVEVTQSERVSVTGSFDGQLMGAGA